MAFVEDLPAFFELADFAENAVFTTVVGPPATTITVPVIFEQSDSGIAIYDRSFYDEKFYAAAVESDKPFLTCQTSQVQALRRNMTLTIRGVSYYVFAIKSDGQGISAIFISKDKA